MAKSKKRVPSTVEFGAVLEDIQRKLDTLAEGYGTTRSTLEIKYDAALERLEQSQADIVLGQRIICKDLIHLKEGQLTLEGKMEKLAVRLDGRGDTLDGKVDNLEGRVDTLDGKVDKLEGKVDKLDAKVDKLDGSVASLATGQARIELRLDELVSVVKRHDAEIIKLPGARRARRSRSS